MSKVIVPGKDSRLTRCKAKVIGKFIGELAQCKRHMKRGKYCYQHQWIETVSNE